MPRNNSIHDEAAGKDYGRRWVAKRRASEAKLSRLEKFHRSLGGSIDWGRWFSDKLGSAFSTAERLYFVFAPHHKGNRQEAQSFWEYVLFPEAADDLSPEFVEGFAEGALEAWDEMSAKVQRPVCEQGGGCPALLLIHEST